jgi:hypothetical protein
MKKSQKSKAAPVIVSTENLRSVVGGANSVFVKPCKTVGGLAVEGDTGG